MWQPVYASKICGMQYQDMVLYWSIGALCKYLPRNNTPVYALVSRLMNRTVCPIYYLEV